LSKIKLFTF